MVVRSLLSSIVLSMLLAGCGDDDSPANDSGPAPLDLGTDAGMPSDLGVAAPDTGPSDDAGECEVTVAPGPLPEVTGTFVIVGSDGGVAEEPTPTGGDPVGVWELVGATVYLPSSTDGLVIASESSIVGTGAVRVDPPESGMGEYALRFDLEITLETTVVGTVRRPGGSRSRGTYTVSDSGLVVMPECTSSASMGMGMATTGALGFSREGTNDTGQLFVEIVGEMGRSLFVADLQRVDGAGGP